MASHSSHSTAYAINRLARDVRALQKEPVDGVAAQLNDANLLIVHANLVPATGDYAGICVHMHLHFPNNYPKHPPTVKLVTPMRHPNVFGDYICLDLLKPDAIGPYQGWSAAYDLAGILRQLYSFLLGDDHIDQDYGNARIDRTYYKPRPQDLQRARDTTCSCGFATVPQPAHDNPPPAFAGASATTSNQSAAPTAQAVPELPTDVLRQVLGYANPAALEACANGAAVDELTQLAVQKRALAEQRCFFTKQPMDDKTILGFGVTVMRHGGASHGGIKGLSMAMDLLSEAAYHQHDVRQSAWNVHFGKFLPLALTQAHAERALTALLSTHLDGISVPMGTVEERLLTALAQLMNSLVVEMVQTDSKQVGRFMSDAALQGFCHLHHLLLSAVTLRPQLGKQLLEIARQDVTRFVNSHLARTKDKWPDLGVLLIKLLLVPKDAMPWEKFAPVFVRELLARQVRWLQYTDLKEPWRAQQDSDDARLAHTFTQSATGLRLVSIESWFANALARPSASDTALQQLTSIRQSYDNRAGAPPPDVFRRFHAYARAVKSMTKWTQWLSSMHLALRASDPGQAKPLMANILRQAAVESYSANYHRAERKPHSLKQYEGWHDDALPLAVCEQEW